MIKKIAKRIISEQKSIELILFLRKVRGVFFFGKKNYCVCCNHHFRKFIPYGNIKRENAACPFCGSLERTRLTEYYLQQETTIFNRSMSVLHFAPEPMLEKKLRRSTLNYVSGDLNPALAETVVDITAIQYPENYFDYVICSHVLGHVPDEAKAIDEVYRVLKPGGRAIILTLINKDLEKTFEDNSITTPELKLENYGESDLVRLHGSDFQERLARDHIKVSKVDYRLNFSKADQIKFSLGNGDRELIFDCEKLDK